jgi:hypothetical protein
VAAAVAVAVAEDVDQFFQVNIMKTFDVCCPSPGDLTFHFIMKIFINIRMRDLL